MSERVITAVAAAVICWLASSPSWSQEACPRNPGALAVGASVTCSCTPEAMKAGAVFGSARYTADSSLCRAAQHAGAVKDTGGVVTAHVAEGCPKFAGSSANGINSNNWGSATAKTFAFAKPAPECGLASVANALKPGSAAPAAPPPAAASGPAPKPTGNVADPCPANASALNPGAAQTCTCAANKITGMGFVYGTARYTPDSSICRAAAHAGAVPAAGGPLVFYVVAGCPTSVGSDSNGIKSASWGSPMTKTVVFAHPTPACGLNNVAAAPKPTTLAAAPAAPAAALPKDCPRTMNTAGMSPGQSVTCGCTPDSLKAGGSVYGTDRYTGDSLTCAAARHAGKVGDTGGAVTVYVAASCAKFEGVQRNGVSSRAWSSAVPQTFAFVSPVPPCVAAPPAAAPKPVATPAPSGPPAGSPMAAWLKRAQNYGTALPEPLPGWTALKVEADASDSAMAGRYVSAFRQYRLGKHPTHLDAVSISIANNPDGSARYPIEFWNDPAKAAAAGYKKVKVAGRDALEFTKKGGDTTDLFFLMSNNLFVTISWQEAHLPRAKMEEYLKVLDFAKIEKLVAK